MELIWRYGRIRVPCPFVQWQLLSFHRVLVEILHIDRSAEDGRQCVPDFRDCGMCHLTRHTGEILLYREPRQVAQTQSRESWLQILREHATVRILRVARKQR